MVKPPSDLTKFESFVEIVRALRGPDGCPWDKEQTHRTLAPFAIEESFELAEAIESGDVREMVGELGDVLLQVVLNSVVGEQSGEFTLEDVVRGISEKMVRRHPHVFGDADLKTSGEVLANWAKVKAEEKKGQPPLKAFDLPVALPALQRAHKIGDKTQKAGFDWPDANGVFEKVEEEMQELREEFAHVKNGVTPELRKALEHEIGDVLFSVSQLARHLGLDGEQSLRVANSRFESRYFRMRQNVEASGRAWETLADSEKEAAWQQAKRDLA